MNKYKMISIVSFVLSCILVLSLLVPMRTIANDKESLEMSMHYEDSKVTVDINVNSEIYTGVICKYLIIDDVLKSDDLLAQTKNSGTTINLDKNENDKYTAVIPNVNKRYIVIYVSIGNCSLCDYLDCQPNKAENEDKQNQGEEKNENNEHKQGVEGESADGQQQIERNSEENKEPEQQPEENKEPEQKPEENKEPEQQPEENKEPEQKPEENKEPEQKPEENKQPELKNENEQKKVEQEVQKQDQNKNDNEPVKTASNTTNGNSGKLLDLKNYDKDNIKSSDKDTIDMSDFQEIEKTSTSTTADGNMPKTGEDDFLKVFGIIVFSSISVVSFYKYKMTK